MQVYTPQGYIHNFQPPCLSSDYSFLFPVDLLSSQFLPTMNMFFHQSVETGTSAYYLHVELL